MKESSTVKVDIGIGTAKQRAWAIKNVENWVIFRAWDYFGNGIWYWRMRQWKSFYNSL